MRADGSEGGRVDGRALTFFPEKRRVEIFKEELSPEDEVAVRFAEVLEKFGIRYVVVAGYLAILFGRARMSDDVDFLAEISGYPVFERLCRGLREAGFKSMQAALSGEDVRKLYTEYLLKGFSVRFYRSGRFIPNVELKLASNEFHRYSLRYSWEALINGRYKLKIAPPELQIAYKLYLGSEKDVDDAVYLYSVFKQYLDIGEVRSWCEKLNVNCEVLGL